MFLRAVPIERRMMCLLLLLVPWLLLPLSGCRGARNGGDTVQFLGGALS